MRAALATEQQMWHRCKRLPAVGCWTLALSSPHICCYIEGMIFTQSHCIL